MCRKSTEHVKNKVSLFRRSRFERDFYKATKQGGTVPLVGGALVCSSRFCGGRTRAFLFGYVVQWQDTRLQNEEYWFKSSLTHKGKYVKFITATIVK